MKLSLRVWPARLIDDHPFAEFQRLIEPHAAQIDELVLIPTHSLSAYRPLEEVERDCGWLTKRIAQLRADGYAVGINEISFGHFDERYRHDAEGVLPRMVGPDGVPADGSLCPRASETLAYLRAKYALMARCDPDFIWVDDDLRMSHHTPAEQVCFCDQCLRRFGDRQGAEWSREELVKALNSAADASARRDWVDFNAEAMAAACATIAGGVRQVNRSIELGLMTCTVQMHASAGARFGEWMQALRASKGRPGGLFYSDRVPLDLVAKIADIGPQTALYPAAVYDIQYELETFPQQRAVKSRRMLRTESLAAIANGVTGITAHILKAERGGIDEHADWIEALARDKPVWTAIAEATEGWTNTGFWIADSPAQLAHRRVGQGESWFDAKPPANAHILAELGIPLTSVAGSSCGTILSGGRVKGFTRYELKEILAGGVVLDGEALIHLESLGLGDHCGVRIVGHYSGGVQERFTGHQTNLGFEGEDRDGRIVCFNHREAYALEPVPGRDVEGVADLVDYRDRRLGSAVTLHRNGLGGRVAVLGYSPWDFVQSRAKRTQLTRVLDWVSGGRLPVTVGGGQTVIAYVRQPDDESGAILVLINGSLDDSGPLTVRLKGRMSTVCRLDEHGAWSPVEVRQGKVSDGADLSFLVDGVEPWDVAIYRASR